MVQDQIRLLTYFFDNKKVKSVNGILEHRNIDTSSPPSLSPSLQLSVDQLSATKIREFADKNNFEQLKNIYERYLDDNTIQNMMTSIKNGPTDSSKVSADKQVSEEELNAFMSSLHLVRQTMNATNGTQEGVVGVKRTRGSRGKGGTKRRRYKKRSYIKTKKGKIYEEWNKR
jgi:hypothetical protein